MSELERRSVRGYGDSVTAGVAEVVTFAKAEEIVRAWNGLAPLWGAALASVLISVAHVLLVPGFAVASVVVFVGRLRTSERTRSMVGSCPDCGPPDFGSAGLWHCHSPGRAMAGAKPHRAQLRGGVVLESHGVEIVWRPKLDLR